MNNLQRVLGRTCRSMPLPLTGAPPGDDALGFIEGTYDRSCEATDYMPPGHEVDL